MERLGRKIASAADAVPTPVLHGSGAARIGIVSLGSCNAAVLEACDRLAAHGIEVDYLRVRGFPFAATIGEFLAAHEINFIVEQNRDGQLHSLLLLETGVAQEKLRGVRDYGGTPLSADVVVQGVLAGLNMQPVATTGGGGGRRLIMELEGE
jgi:2-oxoglutarate ferredoxin oxidoreductase subunit alpha